MLTAYCQKVLERELAKSDYDGKTADQAWHWLMVEPDPDGINNHYVYGSLGAMPADMGPRFDTRFEPKLWWHVAPDGSQGKPGDPAIHGFPNSIERADFDEAWRKVRP
jgi:hypothetical protein